MQMLGDLIDDTGASLISLSGGEPMMRSDIFLIVDFLRDRGVSLNLITNGSYLDDTAISRLSPDKIAVFEIPLLSGTATLHDTLSGSKGAFDRATMAIARLQAAGQTVVTSFVATKINLPELTATIELAAALGVDGLMFNRFNPGGPGFENIDRLQASPKDLNTALAIADRLSGEFGLPISCSVPLPPCLMNTSAYTHLHFGFCALGPENAYFTVDPIGNLRPCNHSPTVIGNLTKLRFWELVDSDGMHRYLTTLPEMCRDCQYVDECKGCCRAAAESCFGSLSAADPFVGRFCDCGRTPVAVD